MEKSIGKKMTNGANYASYQTRLNRNYRSQLLDVLLQGIALFGVETVESVVDEAFDSYNDFVKNSIEDGKLVSFEDVKKNSVENAEIH